MIVTKIFAFLAFLLPCLASDDPIAIFMSHVDNDVEMLWQQMEKDHDQNFDRQDIQSFIVSSDSDGNGHVTREEFLHYWYSHEANLLEVGQAMFLEFDTNGDGIVDAGDLDTIYDRIDISGDGVVDKAEYHNYFKQLLTVLYIIHIQSVPDPATP